MKYLFQPVRPFRINQRFGENKACVTLAGDKKVIYCDGNNPPAGYKSLYGPLGHGGLDLMARNGQEVFAAHDGVVYKIDTDPKSGLDVRLEHTVGDHKFRTVYEHLMGHQVQVGDKVETGQLVGWANNTGYSSGDHLHFQYMVWNGKDYIKTDPLPVMEPTFAPVILLQKNLIKYLKEYVAILLERNANKLR